MPTRTQRLQLYTFLAKLSKHNTLRTRRRYAFYDELFATSFTLAKGRFRGKLDTVAEEESRRARKGTAHPQRQGAILLIQAEER